MSQDIALQEPDAIEDALLPRQTYGLVGHQKARASFHEAARSGKLHHAWLITGPKGIGKATLAYHLTRSLLKDPVQMPEVGPEDGISKRIEAYAEPCLFTLKRPYDEKLKRFKADITVDEVRKLGGFFGLSASDGGHRVVIIDAVDEMNVSASNALLKLLEEPPKRCTLFLISHQPAKLLPTIRSRCRSLPLTLLSPEEMQSALEQTAVSMDIDPATLALASGSVGTACRYLNDDGAGLYGQILSLWAGRDFDRSGALSLAGKLSGAANRGKLLLFFDLLDIFFARMTRHALLGPAAFAANSQEGMIFDRLCPSLPAAQAWANFCGPALARARQGIVVNVDASALVVDMLAATEAEARKFRL